MTTRLEELKYKKEKMLHNTPSLKWGGSSEEAVRLSEINNEIRRIELRDQNLNAPSWWGDYKEANPSDEDDYNPSSHCCARFWKDFCDCTKKRKL